MRGKLCQALVMPSILLRIQAVAKDGVLAKVMLREKWKLARLRRIYVKDLQHQQQLLSTFRNRLKIQPHPLAYLSHIQIQALIGQYQQ